MNYGLPQGYNARVEPSEVLIVEAEALWQPDVHADSASLAKRLGAQRIVEVGCGSGRKLAALHPSFEIVGIDNSGSIAGCRERYDFGSWLEAELGAGSGAVTDFADSVLVCENLIERLVEPGWLMRLASEALGNGAAAIVLSSPDRDLMNGVGHMGPPADPAQVREWTGLELKRYMASRGLNGYFGLTRWSDLSPLLRTIFAVIPGNSVERRQVVGEWWEERARWQQLVEGQDRTIAQQQAWTLELRTIRDWLAQQSEAWEATALEREQRIVELEARLVGALDPRGAVDRTALRWALRLTRPVARVARRVRARRSEASDPTSAGPPDAEGGH